MAVSIERKPELPVVVVADDLPIVRMVLSLQIKALFEKHGRQIEVVGVGDATNAARAMTKRKFKTISPTGQEESHERCENVILGIFDMQMPKNDIRNKIAVKAGVRAAKKVRNKERRHSIIVAHSSDIPKDVPESLFDRKIDKNPRPGDWEILLTDLGIFKENAI
jgi:CheY-like chemotaxis protein